MERQETIIEDRKTLETMNTYKDTQSYLMQYIATKDGMNIQFIFKFTYIIRIRICSYTVT